MRVEQLLLARVQVRARERRWDVAVGDRDGVQSTMRPCDDLVARPRQCAGVEDAEQRRHLRAVVRDVELAEHIQRIRSGLVEV